MTLREKGYTVCVHPAMKIRPGRTLANCEICGALKTAKGWIGGSVDFDFDVTAIARRHAARIQRENAH